MKYTKLILSLALLVLSTGLVQGLRKKKATYSNRALENPFNPLNADKYCKANEDYLYELPISSNIKRR